MNRRRIITGLAAAALLPGTSAAFAQSAAIDSGKMNALMGGDFATATSKLAMQRSSNRMVQTFAELEIAEQAAVAKAFGSRPGTAGLSKRHATLLASLQGRRGREFDRMYINGQIAGHQELLSIHKRYARNGADPMARGASLVGVTGIESHLVMLNTIKSMLS
jgi:putative membrane protein